MLKKGLLIAFLIAIMAGFSTCGALYCTVQGRQPPDASKAEYALEVYNGNWLVAVYLSNEVEVRGEKDYRLHGFYDYDGIKWRYDKGTLPVGPNSGDTIKLIRRR